MIEVKTLFFCDDAIKIDRSWNNIVLIEMMMREKKEYNVIRMLWEYNVPPPPLAPPWTRKAHIWPKLQSVSWKWKIEFAVRYTEIQSSQCFALGSVHSDFSCWYVGPYVTSVTENCATDDIWSEMRMRGGSLIVRSYCRKSKSRILCNINWYPDILLVLELFYIRRSQGS